MEQMDGEAWKFLGFIEFSLRMGQGKLYLPEIEIMQQVIFLLCLQAKKVIM